LPLTPPRLQVLEKSLATIASQVDQVFLCLNQFEEIPAFLKSYSNVNAVIPSEDLKDVGKFMFEPAANDLVVLADDDLLYSPKHVKRLRRIGEQKGLKTGVFGIHGVIYRPVSENFIQSRVILHFRDGLERTRRVHQLGSGTILALGQNVAPLDFMRGSQKFVDVRYARWLHDRGLISWAIERPRKFLREVEQMDETHETIFKTFTSSTPPHVIDEICEFMEEPQ
jgi:hypothetical protein